MTVTDRARRAVAPGITNGLSAAVAVGAAALVSFRLPWAILVAVIGGTLGWVLGALVAPRAVVWLKAHSYAPAGRSVYRLSALPPSEVTAGGKARSLAAMIQAGHPVPQGVVLLPSAFSGDQITAEAVQQLHAELRRIGSQQLFAVRSSALAEDAAEASFAGAYESELEVPRDLLEAAIARVRESRHAERVRAYAAATGADSGEVAVVIQPMVAATQAGVLFTVHPLTGELDTMLGSLVGGLGEALVSGAETGEEFTLSRPSGAYSGPESLRRSANSLHAHAHGIENTFGGVPQDIEWAVAEGKVWIMQARPITTMNPWKAETAELNDSLAGNCLWSATNLSEANPEPQTPLTISLMRYQQANGGPSMALRGREMAGYIGGRPYANLSVQVTARMGRKAKADPREVYRKLATWWGELPAQVPLKLIPMTGADWKDAGLPLLGSLWRMARRRRRVPAFVAANPARCAELSEQIKSCEDPAQLLAFWTEQLFPHSLDSFWAVIASGSDGPAHLEVKLREQLGAEDAAALMSNLTSLVGDFESLGPALGLSEVLAGRLSRDDYAARFGHRGVNEIELAWPRPAERPDWLDAALAGVTSAEELAQRRAGQSAVFAATVAKLRAQDARLAARIERQLREAAKQATLRESARSEGVRTTGVTRRFALRAGELLGIGEEVFFLTVEELLDALAGNSESLSRLAPRRAAYQRYLELPALPGVIYGAFDPFVWAADQARHADYWVAGTESEDRDQAPEEHLIRGFAGAVGQVEGLVRVLDHFTDAGQLQAGEILVTHLTNIGWTPLFPRAAAVVTDLGAPLSHAAIVARELGIPAVVGCADATARLRTGDRVRVDGAHGEVRILVRA